MKSMNSSVPKLFVSTTPPHAELSLAGRFSAGPIPLRQWYWSAKQPPGQRTLGTLSSRSAETTSFRIPRVFGMGESGPTHIPSYSPCPRFSANCPKRLRSILAPGLEASMDKWTSSAATAGKGRIAAMKPKNSGSVHFIRFSKDQSGKPGEKAKQKTAYSGVEFRPLGLKARFWNFLTVQTGCKIRQVK